MRKNISICFIFFDVILQRVIICLKPPQFVVWHTALRILYAQRKTWQSLYNFDWLLSKQGNLHVCITWDKDSPDRQTLATSSKIPTYRVDIFPVPTQAPLKNIFLEWQFRNTASSPFFFVVLPITWSLCLIQWTRDHPHLFISRRFASRYETGWLAGYWPSFSSESASNTRHACDDYLSSACTAVGAHAHFADVRASEPKQSVIVGKKKSLYDNLIP